MMIDNKGNVGIGTTSPTSKLDVVGGDLQVSNMGHFKGWQEGTLTGLGLNVGISNNMGYVMAYDRTNSKYHKLRLTASGGGNGLTLHPNGNIGIDDSTPEAKFTVNGGDLQVSNMGHFKGWKTDNLTGLGLDVGISSNIGYMMAYDRSTNNYHSLRITAKGGLDKGIYVSTNGNIGIDTDSPDNKLSVNGTIRSKEVKVEAINWPDYVFEPDYNLRTLEETEAYIRSNKHLPEIPSAKQMEANGVQLGEMNMLLLKKIEELTLHTIEHEKKLSSQAKKIDNLIQQLKANGHSQKQSEAKQGELEKKIEELTLHTIEQQKLIEAQKSGNEKLIKRLEKVEAKH